MPYWVKVTVDYSGKATEAQSHTFDNREEAYAELAKIKKAQETWQSGSVNNPAPYDEAKNHLPDWLVVHNVGHIVSATVEGTG